MLLIAELTKAQVLAEERAARRATGYGMAMDTLSNKIKRLQDAVVYYERELVVAPANSRVRSLLESTEYELSLLNKRRQQEQGTGQLNDEALTVKGMSALYTHLPADVTVLEFFEGGNTTYMLAVESTGINAVFTTERSDSLAEQVQSFVQHWFANGPKAMINDPYAFGKESYWLYSKMMPGYAFTPGHRYVLVTDGVFSYLPFDALLTGLPAGPYRDWKWLCKKAPLSQAYSLYTWHQQQVAAYAQGDFMGFFVSKGKGEQQPVLSVMQEYNSLHSMLKGVYYIDSSATVNRFNQYAADARVLHISSHAVSSAQDSFAYLQLYDERFYLFDLRYRSFSPSLVVLGACKTADGEWLAGEGVNSLSRGFMAAGAGGVVSGLWNVNDEAAREILRLFYKHLQAGEDAAMALHRAKLQWVQEQTDNPTLQLPYYWAGLVYSGHLQKVPLPGNHRVWYYIIGGLLWVSVIALLFRDSLKRPLTKSPMSSGNDNPHR
jgi:hypothetical protein